MRAEPLGSNALQRWIREANVQEIGGVYYQRTLMPDGKSALIETKPPQAVLEAEKLGNTQISEIRAFSTSILMNTCPRCAKNAAEARQLVELGFDFACNTIDRLIILRKRT